MFGAYYAGACSQLLELLVLRLQHKGLGAGRLLRLLECRMTQRCPDCNAMIALVGLGHLGGRRSSPAAVSGKKSRGD